MKEVKGYRKWYGLTGTKSVIIPLLGISTDLFIYKEYRVENITYKRLFI